MSVIHAGDSTHAKGLPIAATLGALGVVYGDIGTSPLYALKEAAKAAAHLTAFTDGLKAVPFKLVARFEDHAHAVFRTQGEHWAESDALILRQAHAPALGQGGEQQDAFHPSEAFSDALPRSTAEWEIGKFWTRVRFLGPAVGIELLGVGIPARVAMSDVLIH